MQRADVGGRPLTSEGNGVEVSTYAIKGAFRLHSYLVLVGGNYNLSISPIGSDLYPVRKANLFG